MQGRAKAGVHSQSATFVIVVRPHVCTRLTPVLLFAGVLQSASLKNPIFVPLPAVRAQRAHAETASGRAQKAGEPLMFECAAAV